MRTLVYAQKLSSLENIDFFNGLLASIRKQGLLKGQRHHVHLSAETETTLRVGARRGRPILLTIRAGDMYRSGYEFFLTPNQVWLADRVPPEFIEFPTTLD